MKQSRNFHSAVREMNRINADLQSLLFQIASVEIALKTKGKLPGTSLEEAAKICQSIGKNLGEICAPEDQDPSKYYQLCYNGSLYTCNNCKYNGPCFTCPNCITQNKPWKQ